MMNHHQNDPLNLGTAMQMGMYTFDFFSLSHSFKILIGKFDWCLVLWKEWFSHHFDCLVLMCFFRLYEKMIQRQGKERLVNF